MNNLKFSIITPTHIKNSFLDELYDSIIAQTYTNWEWVLWLNGGASTAFVSSRIKEDDRVKIFVSDDSNTSVGYNKNKAFNLGTGDVLVEIDHDDMITENCLEELNVTFQEEDIGFAFSDCAVYHTKNEFVPYGSAYGWSHKTFNWKGKELFSMDSFDPTSKSVAFIWYAPDHVRAWRKNVYKRIGGHDPAYEICDDHELMIRTYLNTKMKHIPKVLYIYRVTGENTWLERNAAIQEKTVEIFNQNAWKLAVREAELRGLGVVELGGGINPKPGCITLDQENADIICDLNDGIPLPDNSVGVLNASHLVEHLHDKHKIMKEIHRVLADGGWAFIEVPSTDGRGAFQDPTHVSYWNENSFWYYTREDKALFIRNKDIRFQAFRLDTIWWEDQIAVTNAWLVAKKSDTRRPHLSLI
jgi:glycosyltransferase involved in cell wall biosynthesis